MAINALTGIPGSGKSHDVVKSYIVPALKAGRTVVHNLRLHDAAMLAYTGARSDQLVAVDPKANFNDIARNVPPGAMVVLDEFGRYFPSGLKANRVDPSLLEFFTMHRHSVGTDGVSMDIVIVCQNLSQVAAFIRDLVETTFVFEKLVAIGQEKRFRCDVWKGPITGRKPPGQPLRQSFGEYDPDIFPLYVSQTQSLTGGHGSEKRIDPRANILKSGRVKLAAAALVLIPFGIWLAVSRFNALAPESKAAPVGGERSDPPRAHGATVVTAAVPAAAPQPPNWSRTWRMAGTVTRSKGLMAVLQSNTGTRLIPVASCMPDPVGDPVCTVDGELIAAWTGAPDKTVFGAAAASAENIRASVP